jgi:hypothetical protein
LLAAAERGVSAAGSSGRLLPPSPPAENAKRREHQAGQSSDGA